MSQKANKIVYYIFTGLLTAVMSMSIVMYLFMHDIAAQSFQNLNFPTWIVYPLAMAKFLGLVAIWTRKSEKLKEWAYAGFFYNLSLALSSHLIAQDTDAEYAIMAIIFLTISYVFGRKIEANKI